ncbi:MAG: iron-containing alcohol dehydrogenase, partial [Acutalibacteraceae bacterium]|nr:iron-containing alcohol dehydrogenase [Acutalibacteraceae bacterium]
MKKLTVNLNRNYDIVIGKGLLSKCGELVRELSSAKRLFIVSDSNVAAIYLDKVKISFENAGFEVYSYIFEAGEQSKTFDTINKIVNAMAKAHITRRDTAV